MKYSGEATHAYIHRCHECRGWRSMMVDEGQRSVMERVTLDEARATPMCGTECAGRKRRRRSA